MESGWVFNSWVEKYVQLSGDKWGFKRPFYRLKNHKWLINFKKWLVSLKRFRNSAPKRFDRVRISSTGLSLSWGISYRNNVRGRKPQLRERPVYWRRKIKIPNSMVVWFSDFKSPDKVTKKNGNIWIFVVKWVFVLQIILWMPKYSNTRNRRWNSESFFLFGRVSMSPWSML